MEKLSDEIKDSVSILLGLVAISLGGTAYQAAGNVVKWSVSYWAIFIGMYVVFFILGIILALKPIKRAYAGQKAIKKYVIDARKENLQLHFLELKISFETNKNQIGKNPLLEQHYRSIISRIDVGCDEILAEEKGTLTINE